MVHYLPVNMHCRGIRAMHMYCSVALCPHLCTCKSPETGLTPFNSRKGSPQCFTFAVRINVLYYKGQSKTYGGRSFILQLPLRQYGTAFL